MKSRLVKFLLLMLLIVSALEIFVRVNSDNFYALSDKLLLKVELLKRNPDTRVLCLGTSRFLDAIDERLFSAEIERQTGEPIKVMNGATTGSQGARFAYIAEIAAKNPSLTHVILEATPPALHDGELNFPDQIGDQAMPDDSGEKFATRVENRLQHWVTQHLALAKYRKALRPATFEKFVVLHTSNFIAPNAWSRKGILRNLFVSGEVEITDEMTSTLQPEIITGKSLDSPPGRRSTDQMYQHLNHISEIFTDSGIQVIWVSPPVSRDSIDKNHNAKYTDFYLDAAHRFGSDFYDYAGTTIDDDLLRDPTHLNSRGRFVFTTLLARELSERIVAESK